MSSRETSNGVDLIESLARDLKPAQPGPAAWKASLAWTMVSIITACILAVLAGGVRPGLSLALLSPQVLLALLVLGMLAAVSATLALTYARPGRSPSLPLKRTPWIFAAMLLAIIASYGTDGNLDAVVGFAASGLECSGILCLAAAIPAIALFAMTRRLAPLRPVVTGSVIGLAAAATGGLGLAFHCPSTNVWHLLVYHLLPIGVVAGVVAAAGARWLRW